MPTGLGLRPGAKAPDEPPNPTGYAPPLDSTSPKLRECPAGRGPLRFHVRLEPDPGIEPRDGRRHLAGVGARVAPEPAAVGERDAGDHMATRVVGAEHRRPDVAAQREDVLAAREARAGAAAPERQRPASRLAVEREGRGCSPLFPGGSHVVPFRSGRAWSSRFRSVRARLSRASVRLPCWWFLSGLDAAVLHCPGGGPLGPTPRAACGPVASG